MSEQVQYLSRIVICNHCDAAKASYILIVKKDGKEQIVGHVCATCRDRWLVQHHQ